MVLFKLEIVNDHALLYYLVLQLVSIPPMNWNSSTINMEFTDNRTFPHEFWASGVPATFSQPQQPNKNILVSKQTMKNKVSPTQRMKNKETIYLCKHKLFQQDHIK